MAETKEEPEKREVSIKEVLATATLSENPDIYANHAQFLVTNSEIIIDLYKLSPDVRVNKKLKVTATRIQRLILPHSLGKGFVEGLANAIASFQDNQGVELVNSRGKDPSDRIKVWE